MESVSGVELARYWLHGEHVLVGGKKMSKSLGNIVYPEDLLGRGFSWEQIRFYLLSRHYRKKLNLSMDELREASLRLDTVREIVAGLLSGARPVESVNDGASNELAGELKVSFETRMNNDLDTATAIDKVFKTVERLHSLHKAGKIGAERSLAIGAQLLKIDSVLQVLF
jgi:cysteinyl-tRNA synthetase